MKRDLVVRVHCAALLLFVVLGQPGSYAAAASTGTVEIAGEEGVSAGNRGVAQDPEGTSVPLRILDGTRLTPSPDYDTQPVVAELADKSVLVAWVRHTKAGDDVVVMSMSESSPRPGQASLSWKVVSDKPGQYIRPVIAAARNDAWCMWTATREDARAAIWYSRLQGGRWSAATRLLPDEIRAHQNPEIAATADGKIAIACQVHTGKSYQVAVTTLVAGNWSAPALLSDPAMDSWDPVVAYDRAGTLHCAWSAFREGDYDIYVCRPGDSTTTGPRCISARGMYDMHPWLAPSPDGTVWISWDRVKLIDHGRSGATTITGANKVKSELRPGEPPHRPRYSGIEVRVLDGDKIRVPGNPAAEITAPAGYQLRHRSLGKVVVDAAGQAWVVYRALLQATPAWTGGTNAGYYWELQARPFRQGHWQEPVTFVESDGYLEEAGVIAGNSGIRVAYTSEHRRTTVSNTSLLKDPAENASTDTSTSDAAPGKYDHHHDYDGFVGWEGDVYLGKLPPSTTTATVAQVLAEELAPAHEAVPDRLTREQGAYSARANDGTTYRLLWGDTHRHSNVSRCSLGTEPSPDDLYRYGMDINMYDFLALSDHSEHMTDYYWWREQSLADLYNIPGVLNMLYNYEWSMSPPHGHHNVIFANRNSVKLNAKFGNLGHTLLGGWKVLSDGGFKAITIPHTSGDPKMGTTWEVHDDRYRRLCEIFQSRRGSYEYEGCPRQEPTAANKAGFYWKALEKGYHMGVIGSSDHGYGCAYACVYAKENTRDTVWQAMWDRRCYASTTYGLIVDARSDQHWMGEEWKSATAPPIQVYVRAPSPIRSIEILGRSKVLHSQGSQENPLNVMEAKLNWLDPDWAEQDREQWYYVRVILANDEMAWTSPMWVSPQPTR